MGKAFPGSIPSPAISSWEFLSAAPLRLEPCPPTRIFSTPSLAASTARTCRNGAPSPSSSARTWWLGLSTSRHVGRTRNQERQSRFLPNRKSLPSASRRDAMYLRGCNVGSATECWDKRTDPPHLPSPTISGGQSLPSTLPRGLGRSVVILIVTFTGFS